MWVCRLPVHIGPRRMNQLYVPPFGTHQPQLVGAEQSPAPTARLRRAASPSEEVVFYTGAASFFAKKRPRGLKIRVVYAIIDIHARGRNPPFPLLWHWKRFDPFLFKHTRASPPPSG